MGLTAFGLKSYSSKQPSTHCMATQGANSSFRLALLRSHGLFSDVVFMVFKAQIELASCLAVYRTNVQNT